MFNATRPNGAYEDLEMCWSEYKIVAHVAAAGQLLSCRGVRKYITSVPASDYLWDKWTAQMRVSNHSNLMFFSNFHLCLLWGNSSNSQTFADESLTKGHCVTRNIIFSHFIKKGTKMCIHSAEPRRITLKHLTRPCSISPVLVSPDQALPVPNHKRTNRGMATMGLQQ